MKFIFPILILLSVFFMAATPMHNHSQESKDLVCGMSVKKANSKYQSTYLDVLYDFCSASCKKSFDKKPERYLKKK